MTIAFSILPTGPSAPTLESIVAELTAGVQAIYGNDIYVDADSQDGQLLNIFATALNDANQAGIAAYFSYSPMYASGTGLSSVVKINGIQREVSTNSTAVVTIIGQAGKTITNGIIADSIGLNTQWALPASITIPPSGTIDVTATCTTPGNIQVSAGTLTTITTPTPGWQSVSNAAAANPGAPVETDAALRQRQAASTGKNALTPISAIDGNIANVVGVTRRKVYENKTAVTDANGIPSHSVACVVEGGTTTNVAGAIEASKAPGCGTYGTTTITVTDPAGLPIAISYFVLDYRHIQVKVVLTPLTGYTTTIGTYVQAAIVAAIDALTIGDTVYYNRMWSPANLSGTLSVSAVSALTGTAVTQAQLDAFSATYDIASLQIADYFGGGITTGTGNAQVAAAAAPTFFKLVSGVAVTVQAGATNTGDTTLNFAASGVLGVRKLSAGVLVPLVGGEVVLGTTYSFVYNGTYWVLQSAAIGTSAGPSGTGDLIVPFNLVAETSSAEVTVTP